jgi:hypothetical protein
MPAVGDPSADVVIMGGATAGRIRRPAPLPELDIC